MRAFLSILPFGDSGQLFGSRMYKAEGREYAGSRARHASMTITAISSRLSTSSLPKCALTQPISSFLLPTPNGRATASSTTFSLLLAPAGGGCAAVIAASTSPISIRKPLIFTWKSVRPHISKSPDSRQRTRSPV